MKPPKGSLYTSPALCSKFNTECADEIYYVKDQYGTEAAISQTYSLGKNEISQRRSTNIVPRTLRYDSSGSSSNPRNTSDGFYKGDDSSDFGECCSGLVPINDIKISKKTNKHNSNYRWERGGRGKPAQNKYNVEIENCQTDTKILNRIWMPHKDNSDIKSHSNHCLNSASNEAKLYGGLFDNYGDSSISDIETVIDSYKSQGGVLTSTPNSDIVYEKVIDADKYIPEESDQNEVHESTIKTNRNACDYNFEIYCDPPSVKNQPIDYSEIFVNNYIPPPVPPSATPFGLPQVQRLPFPVSSPCKLFVPYPVSPQQFPQLITQLRHTQHLFSESPQLNPLIPRLPFRPSYTLCEPRHLLPSSLQPGSPPNTSRMPFYIPPPHLPEERFYPTHSPQAIFNPSCLHQRSFNPPTLKSSSPCKLPVPRPVSPQQLSQLFTQLHHPQHLFTQSPQQYPINTRLPCSSSHTPCEPLDLLSSSLQPGSPPNTSRMPFYIPPPHFPEERFYLPHSSQAMSNPSYLHQRSFNPPTLESHKQNDFFFIPPPKPPPQIIDINQQIYNLNQNPGWAKMCTVFKVIDN